MLSISIAADHLHLLHQTYKTHFRKMIFLCIENFKVTFLTNSVTKAVGKMDFCMFEVYMYRPLLLYRKKHQTRLVCTSQFSMFGTDEISNKTRVLK